VANLRVYSHPINSPEEKARQLALGRIEDSIDAFGGQNTVFRKINRYYHSISPTRKRTAANDVSLVQSEDGREDIFVPMCFALIRSAVPHWMFGLFGQRPHQRFLGRTAEDHEKAEAVTKMVDYHMERADVFLNAIPIAECNYKYGTGIGRIGYRYESHFKKSTNRVKMVVGFNNKTGEAVWGEKNITEKQPIVDFDGPTLDPVSPYLWHPDPLYWQVDRMRYIGETSWTDIDTLKKADEQYFQLTGKHLYKNLDKIPAITRHKIGTTLQMDSSDDTAEAMGWNSSPMWRGRWRSLKQAEENIDEVIMMRHYWEDDRLIEVANDEIVIRNSENPNEDKKKPYVVSTCYPVEFSVWGMGYLHNMIGTQEEMNSWRNLNLRQGRFNVHNVWGTNEDIDIDIDELEPGKIYQVPFFADGKPALVPLMQGRPLPPESRFLTQELNVDAQRAHSAPDWSAGSIGGGSDSATEARLHGQSAASRLKMQGSIGELSLLIPTGRKFLSRIRQYGKDEQVFRIVGKNGSVEFNQITLQELAGEFDVEAVGSFWYPNMDVLRQQMMQALTIVKGDPVMLEITDIYEVWAELWKMFPGVRSTERFLRPPAEKTWDPQKENIILDAGEAVKVNANEPHQKHVEGHMAGMKKSMSEGNDRSVAVYSKHLEEHMGFVQRTQGAQKPQEEPGMQGSEGNVPNMDKAMPTSAGIESRMAGGVGV